MMARKIITIILFNFVLCVTVISIGNANPTCFKCHERSAFSAKIVHQPVAKGQCSVCHNPHVARYEGMLQLPKAELCYSCHKKESKLFTQGFVHEPVRQGNCVSCHDPHASSANGLIRGRQADSCFMCHDSLAKSYKVSHKPYADGRCSTCHYPHQADNLLLLKKKNSDDMCFVCHSRQKVEQMHSDYPVNVKKCLTCHSPHGSSRPKLLRDVLHEPYVEGCKDCHGAGGDKVSIEVCLECHEDVGEEGYASHSHLTDSSGNSCVNCHSPHAGDETGLLKGRQVQVCRTCHEDTFIRGGNSEYTHEATAHDCTICHSVHGSSQVTMLKGDGTLICANCHKDHNTFTHPIGEEAIDPRNNQIMTCVTCHNPHGTDHEYNLRQDGTGHLCRQCHMGYEGMGG